MARAGPSRRKRKLSDEAFATLIEEWKICEAGIARYDSLLFQVRGWAISLVVAILAAAVTLRTPTVAWAGVMVSLLFWWVEAMHDTYQGIYIGRVQAIQRLLKCHVDGTVEGTGFEEPMIAQSFSNSWARPLYRSAGEALWRAFYVNVCATYLSLIVLCAACALLIPAQDPAAMRVATNITVAQ